jgi:hypothetical protein
MKNLTELEKYKIALFMVIRNSTVLPAGEKLGKSEKEINQMAYSTMLALIDETIDFNRSKVKFEEGQKAYFKEYQNYLGDNRYGESQE